MALLETWRGRFIVAFLAVQLLLPLRYYLAHRDPHDERFAWRMFSPMRMARCTPAVTIDGRPANLGGEFHEAWLRTAERGKLGVIEAMGARLCAKYPGTEVRVLVECEYLDRPNQSYGGYDMCTVPEL